MQTNCLTEIFVERALERAKELDDILRDTGKVVGPLHGLPVSLKGALEATLLDTYCVTLNTWTDQFTMKGLETVMGESYWNRELSSSNESHQAMCQGLGNTPIETA